MRDDWDDDHLLATLREAIAARQAVPARFVESGKNAYAWHNVDAELAQLTYDSSSDMGALAALRAETASVRALTFSSARFMIELEVTTAGLLGQIMPPGRGTIEAESQAGGTTVAGIDEAGGFSIEPLPVSPFRLRCRTADGADVVTGWITL
jgi:hypothetical protein